MENWVVICQDALLPSVLVAASCLCFPCQISKTKWCRRKILSPLQEIGVGEQEYDIIFCTRSSYIPRKPPK